MKRITLVLVLLLTLSLASSPLLVQPVQAGEIQNTDTPKPDPTDNPLVDLLGEPDDDGKGDPGNMGDGNGADSGPVVSIGPDGMLDSDATALEEMMLYLVRLIHQLAP